MLIRFNFCGEKLREKDDILVANDLLAVARSQGGHRESMDRVNLK